MKLRSIESAPCLLLSSEAPPIQDKFSIPILCTFQDGPQEGREEGEGGREREGASMSAIGAIMY